MDKRIWTIEEIKDRLQTSDRMVCLSLLKMLERQTDYERAAEYTKDRNGAGFNAPDAPILTSLAKQYERAMWLSYKQIALARKLLKKYSKQLTTIANEG